MEGSNKYKYLNKSRIVKKRFKTTRSRRLRIGKMFSLLIENNKLIQKKSLKTKIRFGLNTDENIVTSKVAFYKINIIC